MQLDRLRTPSPLRFSLALLSVFTVLLLSTAPLCAQKDDGQWQMPANWTNPRVPFAISDTVYYIGSEGLASYLITTKAGHLIIDAPLEENTEMLLENIRSLGFDPQDVHLVIATHGHFDHTGGMAALIEATGAVLVLSKEGNKLVGQGGKGDFFFKDSSPYPPIAATRTLDHLETISLGDLSLTAHLTPGHTRGCTSWSGETSIQGERVPFMVACSLSVLDGYRLVDEPSYPGIGHDFCRSVRHLEGQRVDLFLASHGSFFGLSAKAKRVANDPQAFVDPDGYRAYLKKARDRIEETLNEQGHEGGCETLLSN